MNSSPEPGYYRKKSISTGTPDIVYKTLPKKLLLPYEFDPIPSPLKWKRRHRPKPESALRIQTRTPICFSASPHKIKLNYEPYFPKISQVTFSPNKSINKSISRDEHLMCSWENYSPRESLNLM